MKKRLQLIINIVTIINIIIIIILLYKLITENKYSRKFIIELLETNADINNYIILEERYSAETGTTSAKKISQNDNARLVEYLDSKKTILYANNLEINKQAKTYAKLEMNETDENGNRTSKDITTQDIISLHPLRNEFNSFSYVYYSPDYQYLRKEEYNRVKCIVVEFIVNGENDRVIVWIDLKTGFILKEEYYKTDLKEIITYKTEVNTVEDNEIDIPNLSDYTYIK